MTLCGFVGGHRVSDKYAASIFVVDIFKAKNGLDSIGMLEGMLQVRRMGVRN
jgi:hypothetical protein